MPRYRLTKATSYVLGGVEMRVPAGKVISNDSPILPGDYAWPGGVLPDGAYPVGSASPASSITGADSVDG